MKIKTKLFCSVFLASSLVVLVAASLSAQTVVQGYKSTTDLERGTIVSLDKKKSDAVVPASNDNADQIQGVVINANDAPATLSGSGQQTFVATVGRYEVLVSNEGGMITKGDYITLSSVAGIGMKASASQGVVIGKALSNYNGRSSLAVPDAATAAKNYAINRVLIDISISHNPLQKGEVQQSTVSVLQQIGNEVGRKQVSPLRIYMASTLLLATVVITGALLYSGVRGSLTAIGRNPLSKVIIDKSLAKIILVSLMVFITGVFGVYLLLKL